MKRASQFTLILIAAILCAALSSCNMSEAEKQQLRANAFKTGDAAFLGLLTGGPDGALAGLTAQQIQNIRDRQKTAGKQPAAPVVP